MTDKFTSLTALKASLEAGDYRIRCLDRSSLVTIIAPHGGYIEAGTSALARSLAGAQYNLFDFQGLRPDLANDMHVTATNFRDPLLSDMLRRSRTAVAIHGMHDQGHAITWLGGLNKELKALVQTQLEAANFAVNPDSPRYRGENPRNVVNLPCEAGVQLELPNELMRQLFHGQAFLPQRCPRTKDRYRSFVKALRQALAQYPLKAEIEHDCQHNESLY